MTRRALGRGLSALLLDKPATNSEEMVEIDLDLIEPNNFQPRTNFDEERLEQLAQSIRANGIIQPLLVRRTSTEKYQLVAGERRWRASQRAGLQRVPCVVKDIPEDKMLELALIENIQRQELNAIEEAHAYKRLIESLGLTQEMVAQRVGRDRTFITNYLRLLRLPEDIQQLVETEQISMGHARALLGVDEPDIQRRLAKEVMDKSLSVRQTERTIKRIVEGAEAITSASVIKEDPNFKSAEDKLRRKLSSKVQIIVNQKSSGGKIEIEFFDDNDLNRIYEIIMGKEV
ncbi:MAG: ParB family transcriptional regulator, chromosome partitioning protein [Acidobacteriota bacterium]|jgi:ParB family chromosome partitioning protein|nr:ParB family transcriptional regulator, chromosome partitioning protein [Acidobacteriota bacterium]